VKYEKKKERIAIAVLALLLMPLIFSSFAHALLIDPDVNMVSGNFTLNTRSTQDFHTVTIGSHYNVHSWDGITFHNCTFLNEVVSSPAHLCNCGDDEVDITAYAYAPADWTVTDFTARVVDSNGTVDETNNETTTAVQHNATHRSITFTYEYPDHLNWSEMGWFDVNVTLSAYNATLIYSGYRVIEDVFFVLPPPYNISEVYNATTNIEELNWTSVPSSDYDVVVYSTTGYPECPSDGTEIQNSSSLSNYSFTPMTTGYFSIFSYNSTYNCYSMALQAVWGVLAVNCFNESDPTQNLTFDLFVTSEDGSDTFIAYNCVNTYYIDVDDIPVGNKTAIQIDSDGYEVRYYYRDLEYNHFYLVNTYLPKSEDESGGGDIPSEPQLFAHTDSASVTDPTVDQTINLDHTIEEIIQVAKYTVSSDSREYHENTKSVTNPALDLIIPLSYVATEIVEVSVYNSSISYWVPISSDNYTANSTHVNVSNEVLDENSTIVKVGYYGEGNIYYSWEFIPEDKYQTTGSQCIINKTAIDNDTAIVKIEYYYYGTYPDEEYGLLYVLYVKDYYGEPIIDAKMTFKRYINTTDSFEEVSSLYTDANGQVNLYLIPHQIYKIFIEKDYYQTEISDFTPDPEDRARTFRLEEQLVSDPTDTDIFYGITWSIEPENHYQTGNFTFYFNITSSNNALEWFKALIYYYNETSGAWELLYSQNVTTSPGGGSISYTVQNVNISNITGKYKIECWYKKENCDPYEVTQTGSTIFFLDFGGLRTSPVFDLIPDWAYFLALVIISAIVMAFLLPIAGVGTGYVGIGIIAVGLMLKPDLVVAEISGWVIMVITAFVYTLALFVWSRI